MKLSTAVLVLSAAVAPVGVVANSSGSSSGTCLQAVQHDAGAGMFDSIIKWDREAAFIAGYCAGSSGSSANNNKQGWANLWTNLWTRNQDQVEDQVQVQDQDVQNQGGQDQDQGEPQDQDQAQDQELEANNDQGVNQVTYVRCDTIYNENSANYNANYNADANANYNADANADADADANAEQYSQRFDVDGQMMDLAYVLGLSSDQYGDVNTYYPQYTNFHYANSNYEAEAEDCMYGLDQISQYTMAIDTKLAAQVGINNRCQYTQFYELTYDLADNGGCGDNQYGQYQDADQDEVEYGMNPETIKQNFQNCRDNYAAIGVDIDNLDMDGT